MRHECAVPRCGKSIVAGLIMCRLHWFQVSAPTRACVNHAWAALHATLYAQPRMNPIYLAALKDYRLAHAAAIAEVQANQQQEQL